MLILYVSKYFVNNSCIFSGKKDKIKAKNALCNSQKFIFALLRLTRLLFPARKQSAFFLQKPLVLPGISQNFMTFYHDFEFVLLKTPFGEEPGFLNDTDIQMAVDFLSDLDFVAAE